MVTERHIVSRTLLKGISKGPLGSGLASINIGNADRLALQDLRVPEHSTNRKEKKRKVYASQVQLRALRKGPLTSKLARASPRRFTGPA
eukprot:1160665-Pelagomonas_calceolata.AAC.1